MNLKYSKKDGLKVCAVKAAARIISLMVVGGASPDDLIAMTFHKGETNEVTTKKISAKAYVKLMRDAGDKVGGKLSEDHASFQIEGIPRVHF
jgi:hypothetical protein